jgi:CHAT domain-containing protein/tetratricopeptide (TPR) repeat protein
VRYPPVLSRDPTGSKLGRKDASRPCPSAGALSLGTGCLLLLAGCSDGPLSREPTWRSVRHAIDHRQYSDAVRDSRRLLARASHLHGNESIEAARALDLLSESRVAAEGAHDPEALDCATRALRIKESLLSSQDPEIAISLHNLGGLLYRRGEYEAARPHLVRALSIRDESVGPHSRESAATLLYLAILESDTGNDRDALPLLERALAIQESGMPKTATDVALCWNVRGGILYRLGDYPGAVSSFDRSIQLSEKQGPGQEAAIGRALFNLGGVLLELGEVTRAEEVLERSLELRRRVSGPRSAVVGTTQFSLGAAREGEGDLEGARRSYEEAIRIGEEAAGKESERLVYPLLGLARIDFAEGDSSRAIPHLERALLIREKALGANHPSVAEVLVPLGQSFASVGDTAAAAASLNRAWNLQAAALSPGHPETGITLEALAGFHQRIGATTQALEEALRAEEIGRDHLLQVALGLPEHQALAYAGVRTSGLDRALSILRAGPSDAASRGRVWDALIRSRAVVLDQASYRLRWTTRSSDPRIAELAGSWSEVRQRIAALAVGGPAAGESELQYQAQVERLRREADEMERALATSEVHGARPPRSIGAVDISRAKPAETALVSYVRTDTRYDAFALGPLDSIPEFFTLGNAEEIDSMITQWVEAIWKGIGRSDPALEQASRGWGARVRSKLFDPIRRALRGAKRVLVVPDGALHLVNFYALPDRAGYLVESGIMIHELTCERDLIVESDSLGEGGALIVGGPDFDASGATRMAARAGGNAPTPGQVATRSSTNPCPSLGSIRFRQLPGSLREAEEVASIWRSRQGAQALVLTGADATERSIKRAAAGRELLHLATHGYYLGDCRRSRASARGIGQTSPTRPASGSLAITDRPLLLSGLALAGANRRSPSRTEEDDGILTAEEIACMDLTGTSWAVLSGCQTGLGRMQRSEGVVGLRRAFRIAGVRTMILSLWPVEDQAARVWMRHLYEARWKRNLGTDESIREASLTVLRERRAQARSTDPWSWASFVAAGDWN